MSGHVMRSEVQCVQQFRFHICTFPPELRAKCFGVEQAGDFLCTK